MRTLFIILVIFLTTLPAHAETSFLPATSQYSESQAPFYEEGTLSVAQLKRACAFPDVAPIEPNTGLERVPPLNPECAGYFRAIAGLFQGSKAQAQYLMSKTECYDLDRENPAYTWAIVLSFIRHAHEAPKGWHDAVIFVIHSVVTDYPCTNKEDPDGTQTRGVLTTRIEDH